MRGGKEGKLNGFSFCIIDIHIWTNVHYSDESDGWINLQFLKIYIVYDSCVAKEESDEKGGCEDEMPIGRRA